MMPEGILLDNDVVLKLSIYKSTDDMIEVTTHCGTPPSILGIAQFTLRSHVRRSRAIRDRDAVSAILQRVFGILNRVEPNDDEIEMAGDLEQRAIESGLELDTGESQLFAIMVKRRAPLLITGDKRAIRALCLLAPDDAPACLACLEQLIASIIPLTDYSILRARVCAEPDTDRAMMAIFACSSATVALPDVMIGLRSYINSLRKEAERLLIPSDDLSAIIS